MNKQRLVDTRVYELELINHFWNFLWLLFMYLGWVVLAIIVSKFFLIPWVIFLGMALLKPELIPLFTKKRTVKLFKDCVEIIESKEKIYFEELIWYNDQDSWWNSEGLPTSYFSIKEKGTLFSRKFKVVRKGKYYQNFVGFRSSMVRRIKHTNPEIKPWTSTLQGKTFLGMLVILILLSFGIAIYESPYLFLGILLILIFIIIKSLKS